MFVADDLAAWLVALIAETSSKKLIELVLGSKQKRALRKAAAVAVQDTAVEMSPSGGEQANQLAKVINEVFREPMPDRRTVAGAGSLLEGLQAGIAGQLAVLDKGTVLADKLTRHLVQEIMFRGSHEQSPLTPLANQLNHDLTHLQEQSVEDKLVQLAIVIRKTVQEAKLQPGRDKLRPKLAATTEWVDIRPARIGRLNCKLYATVRNRKNRHYDVNGTCRSSDSTTPDKQISFMLPLYGKSPKIDMGSKKSDFTPKVKPLYDSLFLELKTADGIGDWKRAFKVTTHPRNRGYGPQDMEPI